MDKGVKGKDANVMNSKIQGEDANWMKSEIQVGRTTPDPGNEITVEPTLLIGFLDTNNV
mgnify:FL=1